MSDHQPLLPGKIYHIFNHAIGSEKLFRESDNYTYFLRLLAHHIVPVANVYAYILLPDHFHILLKIKDEDQLSEKWSDLNNVQAGKEVVWSKLVMQQFSNYFNAYAKAYNKRYHRRGALFLDYLKRKRIDSIFYFCHCIHYIHYNAVHHGFCDNLEFWQWSSYEKYLSFSESHLRTGYVLKLFGGIDFFRLVHTCKPLIQSHELEFD